MQRWLLGALAAGVLAVSVSGGAAFADFSPVNPNMSCTGAALSNQATPGDAATSWATVPGGRDTHKAFFSQFAQGGDVFSAGVVEDGFFCAIQSG